MSEETIEALLLGLESNDGEIDWSHVGIADFVTVSSMLPHVHPLGTAAGGFDVESVKSLVQEAFAYQAGLAAEVTA